MCPNKPRFQELRIASAMLAGVILFGFGSPSCGDDKKEPLVDAGGDAPEADTASSVPVCPASCDDQQDCTADSCSPTTFECVHAPAPVGTTCNAKDPCTTNDKCDEAGRCLSGSRKTCTALDQCHLAGACMQATGECSNPSAANGKACNDGLATTIGDQCGAGVCTGTPISCSGGDLPDPVTGSCPNGFPNSLSAQVIENAWGPTNGNGLVRTADGRIFASGYFYGSTNLGSGLITTNATRKEDDFKDIFVAQIDPSTQKALWTQSFHGDNQHTVTSFAVSGASQLGVVGTYSGLLTVGATDLETTSTGDDQYILGVSATDGQPLWARRVGLRADNKVFKTHPASGLRGVAGDPQSGGFVVCGITTKDATDLDPSLVGAWMGGQDVVLARLDGATGKTLWAKQVGGPNNEDCTGVAMDAQSNSYVLGTYRFGSSPDFGTSVPLPMAGDPNGVWAFLAKLDSTGKGLWAIELGSVDQTVTPTAVLVVGSEVFLAGNLASGNLALNGADLGGSSTFLARIDSTTGAVVWAKGIGAGGNLEVTAMAEGANGGLLLTGKYWLPANLGMVPMPAPNVSGGLFVAQVGSDGTVRGARGYGDPSYTSLPAGVVGLTGGTGAELGSSLLLGLFQEKVDLGPAVGLISNSSTVTGSKPFALFLAKLAP